MCCVSGYCLFSFQGGKGTKAGTITDTAKYRPSFRGETLAIMQTDIRTHYYFQTKPCYMSDRTPGNLRWPRPQIPIIPMKSEHAVIEEYD